MDPAALRHGLDAPDDEGEGVEVTPDAKRLDALIAARLCFCGPGAVDSMDPSDHVLGCVVGARLRRLTGNHRAKAVTRRELTEEEKRAQGFLARIFK